MGDEIFHSEVVFVHGMFGQNGSFKSLSKALANEKIRLHTPVLGGYSSDGLFVWFSGKGVLDRVHQSVLELRRTAGEKPWLFGSSLGTIIAIRYALLFPDTISGLILHTIVDLKDLSFVGFWPRLFLRLAKTFRGFTPFLYPLPFPLPWVLGIRTKKRLFYSGGGLMELLYGSKPFPDLGNVHVPVFLLVGSKDRLIPPRYCFEKLKRLKCPKAFSLIDGGTHGVLVTHPLDVSRQIATWLKAGQEMRLR